MKTIAIIAAAVVGTVAATIALHCIVYAILCSAPQENATRVNNTVKAICDYSRSVISGEAEEAYMAWTSMERYSIRYRWRSGKILQGKLYEAGTC